MNKLEKIELEIVKFLRGKYQLNYVPYQYEEKK